MPNKKTIGIVGMGYVGQAIKRFFEKREDVFDIKTWTLGDSEEAKKPAANADLIILSVPTPMREDGSCDTSAIESTLDWIAELKEEFHQALILIKSTIPPGTTRGLNLKYEHKGFAICFSPEYIGEGKYFIPPWKYPHPTDMSLHNFQIFGGEEIHTEKVIQFFLPILGADCRFMQTDSTTAELTKYMENSWGATKVTFCNEFYDIAKVFGVNYSELRELFLMDSRVERMHTAVFKDNRGFGGKCFPKDVNAIVKASQARGYQPKLLLSVLQTNDEIKKKKEK